MNRLRDDYIMSYLTTFVSRANSYTTVPVTANNILNQAVLQGWNIELIELHPEVDLTIDPNYIPPTTFVTNYLRMEIPKN